MGFDVPRLAGWLRITAIGAAAVVAAVAAAGTAQAAGPRQVGSMTFTTTVPGAPTGLVSTFHFRNPDDPGAKPYAVARMNVRGPEGGVIDTTVPAPCRASNAELLALGPPACPEDSRIGGGYVLSDTGGRDPFPRYSRTTITSFNNHGEVIGLGINDDIPAIRAIDRTKVGQGGSSTTFPVFPGVPPPEPYTPYSTLHMHFPPYVRGGRAYNRTPPTCPPAGHWTFTHEFIYHDGVSQTVRSTSPCQPGGSRLAPCLSQRSPLGRRNIGRVRLGASLETLLALPVRPPRVSRSRRSMRWCVKRSRGAVVAVLDRRGRALLLVTTAHGHGNRGLRPGSTVRRMRSAYPRSRRVMSGVLRTHPRSRQLVGVRRGRIRFLAVASLPLMREHRALRRALTRLGTRRPR